MSTPTTARAAWLARCVQRLKAHYYCAVELPNGDRGLTWSEYVRLVEQILAEYREDEP